MVVAMPKMQLVIQACFLDSRRTTSFALQIAAFPIFLIFKNWNFANYSVPVDVLHTPPVHNIASVDKSAIVCDAEIVVTRNLQSAEIWLV
jgi:hypothetical protein